MRGFLFLVFLFTPLYLFSQDDNDPFYIFENLPESPEAATLGQYGEISNNSYTGKANVSIPIYAIDFEGLQIPIQLSYDTGGVRVAGDASWVGLNWNLSTHFGISRSVNAVDDLRDDDTPAGVDGKVGWIYTSYGVNYVPGVGYQIPHADVLDIHLSFVPNEGASKQVDTQPDIFDVSLFGRSYKFRLEKKNPNSNVVQTHVYNNNNVIITYDVSAQNESFTIIDEAGFTYEFKTKDYSASFTSSYSSSVRDNVLLGYMLNDDNHKEDETVATSWLLDKIVSPRGKTLDFSYNDGISLTVPSYSGTVRIDNDGGGLSSTSSGGGSFTYSPEYNASVSVIHNHYLDKISGDFGEVIFNIGAREDILTGEGLQEYVGNNPLFSLHTSQGVIDHNHGGTGGVVSSRLDDIQIKDYNGNTVITANFNYSYFNNNVTANKAVHKRLKLSSLDIGDRTYSFEYDESSALPAKDTDDTDFWGFYNGAGNTGNVPSIGRFVTGTIVSTTNLAQDYFNYDGADKGSDFNFGKLGLLTKITYPTGGYSMLNYEPHDAMLQVAQPWIVTEYYNGTNRLQFTDLLNEEKYRFTYQYLKKAKTNNLYNYYDHEDTSGGQQTGVTVQVGEPFEVPFTGTLNTDGDLYTITGTQADLAYWSDFENLVVRKIDQSSSQTMFVIGDWPPAGIPNMIPGLASVPLGPGWYEIAYQYPEYDPNAPGFPTCRVYQDVNTGDAHELITTQGGNQEEFLEKFEIGGARIKDIIHYDNNQAFISKKAYDYTFPDITDPDFSSSGLLMDDLIYFSKAYGLYSYNPRIFVASKLRLGSNNLVRTNPSAQGSHVGYSVTRELTVDENDVVLGWVERTFQNAANNYHKDSFCRSYMLGGCVSYSHDACIYNTRIVGLDPEVSYEYSNGNVLEERIYSNEGIEVSRVVNTYETLNGNTDDQHFAAFMAIYYGNGANYTNPCSNIPFGIDHSTYFVYNAPSYYSKQTILTKSERHEYFGNQEYYSEDRYFYDSDTHHLNSTETYVTETDVAETQLYYPYDSEVSAYASNLVAENQLSTVVKSEQYRNGMRLSSKIYNFSDNGQTGNHTLVTSVLTSKGDDTEENRAEYELYDDDGNLLQKRTTDGIPISFIWGYKEQYIVAKVENATYSQIEGLSGFGSGFTIVDGLSAAQDDALRTLSGAMVTTYAYEPLIGVTAITDPRGNTSVFEYDGENRLQYIRDRNNNIVEEYNYNITDAANGTRSSTTTSNPPVPNPISLASFASLDTSLDENGDKKLYVAVSVTGEQNNTGVVTITYKAVGFGGSGNYEYRWRAKGDEFGAATTNPVWNYDFDCSAILIVPVSEIVCEITDTTTGNIYTRRFSNHVQCQN